MIYYKCPHCHHYRLTVQRMRFEVLSVVKIYGVVFWFTFTYYLLT